MPDSPDDKPADYATREGVVAAMFHGFRSARKRKDTPESLRLLAALEARIEADRREEKAMADKPIEEMTDEKLRAAIHACDTECDDYEDLMKEAEARDLDF